MQVHALEVVPLVLGRLDAVADEHQLGVVERRRRRAARRRPRRSRRWKSSVIDLWRSGAANDQVAGTSPVDADDLERLLPGAARAAGLEAVLAQHRRQIGARARVAGAARAASLHQSSDNVRKTSSSADRWMVSAALLGAVGEEERRLLRRLLGLRAAAAPERGEPDRADEPLRLALQDPPRASRESRSPGRAGSGRAAADVRRPRLDRSRRVGRAARSLRGSGSSTSSLSTGPTVSTLDRATRSSSVRSPAAASSPRRSSSIRVGSHRRPRRRRERQQLAAP